MAPTKSGRHSLDVDSWTIIVCGSRGKKKAPSLFSLHYTNDTFGAERLGECYKKQSFLATLLVTRKAVRSVPPLHSLLVVAEIERGNYFILISSDTDIQSVEAVSHHCLWGVCKGGGGVHGFFYQRYSYSHYLSKSHIDNNSSRIFKA